MRIEATGSNNDVVLYVNSVAALRCDESTSRVELDSTYKIVSAWAYNNVRSGRVQMVDSSGIFGYQSSSKKYKENIKKLKDESFESNIDLFEPVMFNYKPDLTGGDGSEEFGFIAEDIEKIDPRLVFYDELPDGKREVAGIHFHALHAYEIDELQKLRARVAELETQVADLLVA